MQYDRQSEKLSAARRCLMLPHSSGVDQSIDDAFRECGLALHRMDESVLDDNARNWVSKIKEFMKIVGYGESSGLPAAKARSLTSDEQVELSNAVDELAHWFDEKYWQDQE